MEIQARRAGEGDPNWTRVHDDFACPILDYFAEQHNPYSTQLLQLHTDKMQLLEWLLDNGAPAPSPRLIHFSIQCRAFLSLADLYRHCLLKSIPINWPDSIEPSVHGLETSTVAYQASLEILTGLMRQTVGGGQILSMTNCLRGLDRFIDPKSTNYEIPPPLEILCRAAVIRRLCAVNKGNLPPNFGDLGLPRSIQRKINFKRLFDHMKVLKEQFNEESKEFFEEEANAGTGWIITTTTRMFLHCFSLFLFPLERNYSSSRLLSEGVFGKSIMRVQKPSTSRHVTLQKSFWTIKPSLKITKKNLKKEK